MAAYSDHDRARQRGGSDDYRGPFGRDRDRILYSSAFRRLAGKTQVVAVGELGDFHNRMTHTLKVAQLGRRLAERLREQEWAAGRADRDDPHSSPNPDLVEAACLAHDLGHPPFGHVGEQSLSQSADELASEIGYGGHDGDGFEGNAQTLRILVRLSARPPRETWGLDLCRATLDATIKYPWYRNENPSKLKKWNAYRGDDDSISWIRDGPAWGPQAPRSFEAQVMDWCDDVTYACHDVEDFYRAGIVPLELLFEFPDRNPRVPLGADDEPEALRPFFDYVSKKWGGRFSRDEARNAWRMLSQFVSITKPYAGDRETKVELHRTTSSLITRFFEHVRAEPDPCTYGGSLVVPSDIRLQCDLLQELNWYFVIDRPALASQQHGHRRVVRDLLRIYAIEGEELLLPPSRREECDDHGDRLRAAIDHVASLTEPTALALHQRLTGIRTGQHSDPIWHE